MVVKHSYILLPLFPCMCPWCAQQQYIFLHEVILEYVVCGQTEISCDNFTKELAKLKQVNPTSGKSKLQNQFEASLSNSVLCVIN